jgi:hypothetical protein
VNAGQQHLPEKHDQATYSIYCAYEFLVEPLEILGSKMASPNLQSLNTWPTVRLPVNRSIEFYFRGPLAPKDPSSGFSVSFPVHVPAM